MEPIEIKIVKGENNTYATFHNPFSWVSPTRAFGAFSQYVIEQNMREAIKRAEELANGAA